MNKNIPYCKDKNIQIILIYFKNIFMRIVHSTISRRLFLTNSYRFCADIQRTKKILSSQLFSIDLINKNVNRHILSMLYSPGVGAVCQKIQQAPQVIDSLTLRGRSFAIVTDGSILKASSSQIKPVMDWFVAQLKYYSSYDPFPFVIEKGSNLNEIIKDLSTTYRGILLLDDCNEQIQIPENTFILRHQDVVKLVKCELTDAEHTAKTLAYIFENKITGLIGSNDVQKGSSYEPTNFFFTRPYDFLMKDGRDLYTHSLQIHKFYNGKVHIELGFRDINKIKPYFTEKIIRKLLNQKDVYSKTSELSAIVTDGTAVLGYGNIGPKAGLPVMQGKSLLFKLLGNVEVVPVCIYQRKSPGQCTKAIKQLLHHFQAINIEDIKAPQCFTIEQSLKSLKKTPIFHDDQHGTAIVTLAGLINAAKVVQKDLTACEVVINGAGAAGLTIAKLLAAYGVKDIVICDSNGAIYKGRSKGMNIFKQQIAQVTNLKRKEGELKDVMENTDIFIGVSIAGALTAHQVAKMNKRSIIFALANPIPEIMPLQAKAAGAEIYGSGRSDLQNQINNSLVFPGIFRAIKEHKLTQITTEMKLKAAEAIATCLLGPPRRDYIIPHSLDKDVSLKIAKALKPGKE